MTEDRSALIPEDAQTLGDIADMLSTYGEGFRIEHNWIRKDIEEARKEAEGDIEMGFGDPDREFDQPLMWRRKVDQLLENLDTASRTLPQIAALLRQIGGPHREDVAGDEGRTEVGR